MDYKFDYNLEISHELSVFIHNFTTITAKQPEALIMYPRTFTKMHRELLDLFPLEIDPDGIKFQGIKIFRSEDAPENYVLIH